MQLHRAPSLPRPAAARPARADGPASPRGWPAAGARARARDHQPAAAPGRAEHVNAPARAPDRGRARRGRARRGRARRRHAHRDAGRAPGRRGSRHRRAARGPAGDRRREHDGTRVAARRGRHPHRPVRADRGGAEPHRALDAAVPAPAAGAAELVALDRGAVRGRAGGARGCGPPARRVEHRDPGHRADRPPSCARCSAQPDPTRQQSLDELERLHRAAIEDEPSEPELLRRRIGPLPDPEVDPDDIESAIEIAPPARRAQSSIAVAKPSKKSE